jgi:hypothetical protein
MSTAHSIGKVLRKIDLIFCQDLNLLEDLHRIPNKQEYILNITTTTTTTTITKKKKKKKKKKEGEKKKEDEEKEK